MLSLYASQPQRQLRLAGWVREGLDGGEKILCPLVPTAHATESLWRALEAQHIDPARAYADGLLQPVPLPRFYDTAGALNLVDEALAQGHPGVRLFHEPYLAPSPLPWTALMSYEHAIERMLAGQERVSMLCQYPVNAGSKTGLREALEAHGGGARGPHVQTIRNSRSLSLSGPLDEASADVLATALRTYTDTTRPVVRIDLSGAHEVGVVGCRILAEGTRDYRRRGGQIQMTALPQATEALREHGLGRLINLQVA